MEALVALSLACNVMQVISFGLEAVRLYKTIKKEGSADHDLVTNINRMGAVARQLEAAVNAVSQTNSPLTSHQYELLEVAKTCRAASEMLGKELGKINSARGGSLRKAIQTRWKASRIKELEQTLMRHQRDLHTRLLVLIWTRQDAIQCENQGYFTSLDSSIKDFVKSSVRDQAKVLDIIDTNVENALATIAIEHTKTRSVIRSEHDQTRGIIRDMQVEGQNSQSRMFRKKGYQQVIRSLRYPEMNARRTQIKDAYANSFQWIFQDQEKASDLEDARVKSIKEFRKWLKSENPLFWVSGKAGSGKSTLMKLLVADERTLGDLREWAPTCQLYSYFIWNSGTPIQRDLGGLLSSLLYQIFKSDGITAETLIDRHKLIGRKHVISDWGNEELQDLIQEALVVLDSPVCFFIDGLDEIATPDGPSSLSRFMEAILQTRQAVKVCTSSRPEPYWRGYFGHRGYPCFKLQELTKADMEEVARQKLRELPFCQEAYTESQLDGLIRNLVAKAEGVFLWLILAINSIKRGTTIGENYQDLLKRLEQLPGDLQNLYLQMWMRLGDDMILCQQRAALYFKLVLRLSQTKDRVGILPGLFRLMIACSQEVQRQILSEDGSFFQSDDILGYARRFKSQIMSYSAGLLEVSGETETPFYYGDNIDRHRAAVRGRVDFIHRSARDFLLHSVEGRKILEKDGSTECELDYALLMGSSLAEIWNDYHSCNPGADRRFYYRRYGDRGILLFSLLPNYIVEQNEERFFNVLRNIYSRDSMRCFYEQVASKFWLRPLQKFLDTDLSDDKLQKLRSYFLAQAIHPNWGLFESANFWFLWPSELTLRFLDVAPRVSEFVSSLLEGGVDPGWSSLLDIKFYSSSFLQLFTLFELFLLVFFRTKYAQLFFYDLLSKFIKSTERFDRKIVLPFRYDYQTGLLNYPPAYDVSKLVDHIGVIVMLELNVPQLVNDLLWNMTFKLEGESGRKIQTIYAKHDDVARLLFDKSVCHRDVLLIAYKSGPSAEFLRPEPAESSILLEIIDGMIAGGSPDVKHHLEEKLEQIRIGNAPQISDVSQWLRERGYFIPEDHYKDELRDAPGPLERVEILDRLQREAAQYPNTGRNLFRSDASEFLAHVKVPKTYLVVEEEHEEMD